MPHSHVAHKGLEVVAFGRQLSRLAEIPVEDIPSDPTRDIYRQGATVGDEYKHWFRAKFLQQFRLFFRYQQSADAKVIVLAWVNDDSTLRAYESANDADAVFRKMLKRCNPPDDWTNLAESARALEAKRLLRKAAGSQE